MNSYRVYQIAKENNLTSKEVIDICIALGIDAKSHSSAIGEGDYKKIVDNLKIKKSGSEKEIKKDNKSKGKNPLKGSVEKTIKIKDIAVKEEKDKSSKKINIEKQILDTKSNKEKSKKDSLKPMVQEPVKAKGGKVSISKNIRVLEKNENIVTLDTAAAAKDIDIEDGTTEFENLEPSPVKEIFKSKPLKWEEEKKLNVRSVLFKELDKEDKLDKSRGKSVFAGKTDVASSSGAELLIKKKKDDKPEEVEEIKKRPEIKKLIEIPGGVTIKQLSERINIPSSEIIATLIKLGEIVSINQQLDNDLIELIAAEYNFKFIIIGFENKLEDLYKDEPEDLVLRPPVVTVMGHVDHGKTTLLDAIRKADVAGGEAGGITQHIGAYQIEYNNRKITFIDTPGHEAFTAMRARGARVTDIAVIVVAANDGIMPQSVEAIDHAKAAGVTIIVAINKIDLPDADPEKVKKSLTEYGLVPEEWGGDTICVEVSAKNKIKIDELLEMILLVADMHEIKGNPNAEGYGIIIESRLDKGMGPVGSVIVKRGSIKVGDFFITGNSYGKVRALQDDKGTKIAKAVLSQPVEILGFSFVPKAGDKFFIVKNEKIAKELLSKKLYTENLYKISESKRHITLEQLSEIAKLAQIKKLGIVLKADVNGSLDAVEQALKKIETEEVKIDIIHRGVGAIIDSDIVLASASNAIVIGFGVVPTSKAKAMAKVEKVEIRTYEIIYKLIDDLILAFKGMLEPKFEEVGRGMVEVREVFKMPKVGLVAGCYVTEGEVERNNPARIVRDGKVVFTSKISSIHRFKEDVKKVAAGYECGIKIENFQDINKGDFFEVFEIREVI
ncbi:MAG: translation initiation factor IF-2, partial [Actinobacteria bacterium]|nr:translation initiation factor IF-2 [Actinomycetota bacterium]